MVDAACSTAFGCSFDGVIPVANVVRVAVGLAQAGADCVILADTVGYGNPLDIKAKVRAVRAEIFDLDRHWIPPRKTDPGHYHYDLRFVFEADPRAPLVISSESKDLAWLELGRVVALNPEESMARMVRKTLAGV